MFVYLGKRALYLHLKSSHVIRCDFNILFQCSLFANFKMGESHIASSIAGSATNRLVCIEYPALINDVSKMLHTLGGLDHLSRCHASEQPRIELRFRPSDPFAHGTFGDRTPANSLLMRTRALRRTYNDGRVEIVHETKPVGVIDTVYKFKSLCDFQYLPMSRINPIAPILTEAHVIPTPTAASSTATSLLQETTEKTDSSLFVPSTSSILNNQSQHSGTAGTTTNESNRASGIQPQTDKSFVRLKLSQQSNQLPALYRSISNEILCHRVFDYPPRTFDAKAPSFLLPIIFSRFDMPSYYFYRNDPKHRDKAIAEEIDRQNKLSIIGRNRKSRSVLAYLINWNAPVPTAPDPKLQAQLDQVGTDHTVTRARSSKGWAFHVDHQLLTQLRACFQQRPIWSRSALVFELNCDRQDIRHLLTCCAFYYCNGPFRGMWVRFGYDPRQHPESKIYQTLDFRLKHHSILKTPRSTAGRYVTMKKAINDKKARVALIHQDAFGFDSNSVRSNQSRRSVGATDEDAEFGAGSQAQTAFKFRPNVVPLYRQTFYQMLDIEMDQVQDIVHSNDGAESTCDEKDGWLASGSIERIRLLMHACVSKTSIAMAKSPDKTGTATSSCSEDDTVDEEMDVLDDDDEDEDEDDDEESADNLTQVEEEDNDTDQSDHTASDPIPSSS